MSPNANYFCQCEQKFYPLRPWLSRPKSLSNKGLMSIFLEEKGRVKSNIILIMPSRLGTKFIMNRLESARRVAAISALIEGCSIRSTVRIGNSVSVLINRGNQELTPSFPMAESRTRDRRAQHEAPEPDRLQLRRADRRSPEGPGEEEAAQPGRPPEPPGGTRPDDRAGPGPRRRGPGPGTTDQRPRERGLRPHARRDPPDVGDRPTSDAYRPAHARRRRLTGARCSGPLTSGPGGVRPTCRPGPGRGKGGR